MWKACRRCRRLVGDVEGCGGKDESGVGFLRPSLRSEPGPSICADIDFFRCDTFGIRFGGR